MISGIKAMHMVKKDQLMLKVQSVKNQNKCIHQLFGIYHLFAPEPFPNVLVRIPGKM